MRRLEGGRPGEREAEVKRWAEERERSASRLTAEEADLLAPLVLADYAPWVVPPTVRPNGEDATDMADD